MTRKGRRGLTPEDRALWDRVKRTATPMRPEPRISNLSEVFEPSPVEPRSMAPFRIGEKPMSTVLPPFSKADVAAIQMDKKAFGQLKRGKLKPEARIDLHGMTLAQAHPELNRFITDTYAKGYRLVLVITGKGKDRDDGGPIPVPRGVLKRQVPEWLRQSPLSGMILQVTDAHLKHGGGGALYVYLKRRK